MILARHFRAAFLGILCACISASGLSAQADLAQLRQEMNESVRTLTILRQSPTRDLGKISSLRAKIEQQRAEIQKLEAAPVSAQKAVADEVLEEDDMYDDEEVPESYKTPIEEDTTRYADKFGTSATLKGFKEKLKPTYTPSEEDDEEDVEEDTPEDDEDFDEQEDVTAVDVDELKERLADEDSFLEAAEELAAIIADSPESITTSQLMKLMSVMSKTWQENPDELREAAAFLFQAGLDAYENDVEFSDSKKLRRSNKRSLEKWLESASVVEEEEAEEAEDTFDDEGDEASFDEEADVEDDDVEEEGLDLEDLSMRLSAGETDAYEEMAQLITDAPEMISRSDLTDLFELVSSAWQENPEDLRELAAALFQAGIDAYDGKVTFADRKKLSRSNSRKLNSWLEETQEVEEEEVEEAEDTFDDEDDEADFEEEDFEEDDAEHVFDEEDAVAEEYVAPFADDEEEVEEEEEEAVDEVEPVDVDDLEQRLSSTDKREFKAAVDELVDVITNESARISASQVMKLMSRINRTFKAAGAAVKRAAEKAYQAGIDAQEAETEFAKGKSLSSKHERSLKKWLKATKEKPKVKKKPKRKPTSTKRTSRTRDKKKRSSSRTKKSSRTRSRTTSRKDKEDSGELADTEQESLSLASVAKLKNKSKRASKRSKRKRSKKKKGPPKPPKPKRSRTKSSKSKRTSSLDLAAAAKLKTKTKRKSKRSKSKRSRTKKDDATAVVEDASLDAATEAVDTAEGLDLAAAAKLATKSKRSRKRSKTGKKRKKRKKMKVTLGPDGKPIKAPKPKRKKRKSRKSSSDFASLDVLEQRNELLTLATLLNEFTLVKR